MEKINLDKIKKEIYAKHGMQTAIAKELKITKSTITQQLNSKNNTGWQSINKIISAYNKLKEGK
jgi:DNA-binding MarR family transcriptional regulator